MIYKVLANIRFGQALAESSASTPTGQSILEKYKAWGMNHEDSCATVNMFIKEANTCKYDSGICNLLEMMSDYITANKVSWALATACESITNNARSYNMLDIHACKQVQSLLEMQEDDVVKYINAGALKNVMYNESFRNIAKAVFRGKVLVEAEADYVATTPVSMVEEHEGSYYFKAAGYLYKIKDGILSEAAPKEVSHSFHLIESLLESNICKCSEGSVDVSYMGKNYTVTETNKVSVDGKEMTTEAFRDSIRLVMMSSWANKNQRAQVLEAVAQVSECFDSIALMDNVAIYESGRNRFLVIGGLADNKLYARSLNSNWSVCEGAIDTCKFIKAKANVTLDEKYINAITKQLEEAEAEEKVRIEEAIKKSEKDDIARRIDELTEKFKDSPATLAVLSKLASDYMDIVEADKKKKKPCGSPCKSKPCEDETCKEEEEEETIKDEKSFRAAAEKKFETVFGDKLDKDRMEFTIKGLLKANKDLVEAGKWGELIGMLNKSFGS